MILETYQEEKAIEPQEESTMAYATITEVTNDGLIVTFDGETEASNKAFPCNSGISYAVGDRVLMQKINGSYIVICTVGRTGSSGGGGGSTEQIKYIEKIYGAYSFTASTTTIKTVSLSDVKTAFAVTDTIVNVDTTTKLIVNAYVKEGTTPTLYMRVYNPTTSAVNAKVYCKILYKETE